MYKENQGIILIDVILALAVGATFLAVLTDMSISANNIFNNAHYRSQLVSLFEAHNYDFENSVYTSTSSIVVQTKLYGNDTVQKDIEIKATSSDMKSISGLHIPNVKFTSINLKNPNSISDSMGTPLCSVSFRDHNLVGSNFDSNYKVQKVIPKISPILLPISMDGLDLTDFQIRNGIAYVTADPTNISDPDLFIFDIHNTDNVVKLSSLNTGPGLSSLVLVGNHVYASALSTANQLDSVLLNSLNEINFDQTFKLQLPYATATLPYATSIFYNNKNIFLGTEKWDGEELSVINMSTTSSGFVKIGGFETDSKINDLWVNNNYLYIADSDMYQARSINLDNPSNPYLTGNFSPSGWSRQQGKVITGFENQISLGRTNGGFNITNDKELFLFSTTSIQGFIINNSSDIQGGVYGIVQDRFGEYIITHETGKEFQIIDKSFVGTTIETYSLPIIPSSLTCDGDNLYILSKYTPVIYEISF